MSKEIFWKMTTEERHQYELILASGSRVGDRIRFGESGMTIYKNFCKEMVDKYEPTLDPVYIKDMSLLRKALEASKQELFNRINDLPPIPLTKDDLYPIKDRVKDPIADPIRLGLH